MNDFYKAVGWDVVENVAILAAMCFLIWLTDIVWWCLLLVFMNSFRIKPDEKDKDES